MNTDRANGLVLTGVTVSAALVLVKHAANGELPEARWYVGVAVAGLGLAVLAQTAPTLAGGLAVLMVLTSALVYGGPAWDALSAAVGDKT